jgi:hypothetical protein
MLYLLLKSFVQGHVRHDQTGNHFVAGYQDKRTRREGDEPVLSPTGRDNFGQIMGEIARAAGIPPGPIKLMKGQQFADHKGYGKEHMAQQHGEEIRQAGYKSEEDFVADVVRNYSSIWQVGPNRYALAADGQRQKVHILELRHEHGQQFYSVVTGFIADRSYLSKYKPLWRKQLRKALDVMAESLALGLYLVRPGHKKSGGSR